MISEYKPVTTYDENGKALIETVCDINQPADYSFATVSDFIHGHDRTFEELQSLCLGMAAHIEKLERVKNDGDVEKKHWYSFSFYGIEKDLGRQCNASTYIGYEDNGVTMSRIKHAKEAAGVSIDAVLLNVSYLGHMTKEQFLT